MSVMHLWYLINVGKDSPIIQCKKVLRGTGYIIKSMSRVAAHPMAPEVLHVMSYSHTCMEDDCEGAGYTDTHHADIRTCTSCCPISLELYKMPLRNVRDEARQRGLTEQ